MRYFIRLICFGVLFPVQLQAVVVNSSEHNNTIISLLNTRITSVSRVEEDPFDAAAAVYVITKRDIERSGATNIAEVLRMAPGIQVARAGSNQWAISARGFNDQFSNKLLIMIDGRVVYTPLFSGVFWDTQDVILDDIKHIEVIRGPGAAQWGANAVNGVINIITEDSVNTLGGKTSLLIGNKEQILSGRYGQALDSNSQYRVFAKGSNFNSLDHLNGTDANDSWNNMHSGFRFDSNQKHDRLVTVQGDIYYGKDDRSLLLPDILNKYAGTSFYLDDRERVSGGNVMAKISQSHDNGATTIFSSYFDNVRRDSFYLDQTYNVVDFDVQHNLPHNKGHEISFGGESKFIFENLAGTEYLSYKPDSNVNKYFNGFVQDRISIVPDKLILTLGTKLEHNDFTGLELQPNARVSYLISKKQTLWGAISRATRVPNRTMESVNFYTLQGSNIVRFIGNKEVDSEELWAYEIGYRVRPTNNVFVDISTFYNDYNRLASNSVDKVAKVINAANEGSGKSYGFEVATRWEMTPRISLMANYSALRISLDDRYSSAANSENKSPRHQASLLANFLLADSLTLNSNIYYSSSLDGVNVPSYTRFDSGITWNVTKNIDVSLVGQNLLDSTHQEFGQFIYSEPEIVGRSYYIIAGIKF